MNSENKELQNYLDQAFGSDVKTLSNVEELFNEASKKQQALMEQLSVIQTEVPSKIKAALASADQYLDKVEEFQLAKTSVNSEVSKCIKNGAPAVERFQQSVKKVDEINKYMSYMKWIARIEDTSGGVQQSILSDDMKDACGTLQKLLQYHTTLTENSTKCENLVTFLRSTILFWYNILKDKLSKELDIILKQISWPFISAPGPKTLPEMVVNLDKSPPSPHATQDPTSHLRSVISNLLLIHLPIGFTNELILSNAASSESAQVGEHSNAEFWADISLVENPERDVVLLPFQLLLHPLKKRFRYHFTGNKQTNDLNKPEWYLTQVINWINHHAAFLEHTIQPILDSNQHAHIDALMMFTQGLLQLVTSKLSSDIDEIMYRDDLFSHTVDEVLLFDRELRISYDISDFLLKTYGPITVLTRPDCIRKWLNVERTCADERLDGLFSSEDAWMSHLAGADEYDEMKTPECAEAFVTMLLTITDSLKLFSSLPSPSPFSEAEAVLNSIPSVVRTILWLFQMHQMPKYKHLPSYKEQLQFLDLQMLLLDGFRIRLTQVMRSRTNSQYDDILLAILNAALYVTTVLREWADNVFFLELKFRQDGETASPTHSPTLPNSFVQLGENNQISFNAPTTDETVFDSVVNLYDRIYLEGLDGIAQAILAEYKSKSQPYLYDQWLALPLPEEQVTFVVSRSACPMLEVLQERLYTSEQKLCRILFTKLWRCIAENVDKYVYEEVVLKNYFNGGGASQLQFDMARNLFPMFGPYTNKPENYFKRMKESCLLLNLQSGNALLLKEAISCSTQNDNPYDRVVPASDPSKILAEMGMTLFSISDVAKILKRRIDWTPT